MDNEKTTTEENVKNEAASAPVVGEAKTTKPDAAPVSSKPPFARQPRSPRSRQPSRTFSERPKPEFDQKMIDIRRVTRVVSGGRRMSFAVAIVIGDRKGSVGLGTGKAVDTALAIGKALKTAKKSMIKIHVTKDMSIPHEVSAKFTSSKVSLVPNRGKGLVAGSAARTILSLAGVTNVTAKYHSGSKNKLNNARAAMEALTKISSPHKAHVKPVPVSAEEVKS